MSMSVSTKYAAYFVPVVGNMIHAEVMVKGLATTFHEKIQLVMTEAFEGREYDGEEAAGLHLSICNELEHEMLKEVEKYYPKGTTLTEAVSMWKNYKSIYKNGMLMGLNPVDFTSFRQFKEAKLAKGKKAVTASESITSSAGGDAPIDSGGDASNTANIVPVSNGLSDTVNARLDFAMQALKQLAELDEESALEVLGNMEGACRSKMRKGNRMMALK